MTNYKYAGAAALTELHEHQLRKFVKIWQEARGVQLELPATDDQAYASLDRLAWHVFECAGYYISWAAKVLDQPAPRIPVLPPETGIALKIDDLLERTFAAWQDALAAAPQQNFCRPEYEARWGTKYCVDAMLEHAVMHPLRHAWQLRKLLATKSAG